ncbi:MAG: hypothetical protein JXQ29_17045 [Planctomycetes bacterium]|nr:hypothetical protein [Planctomycetota bacterium]
MFNPLSIRKYLKTLLGDVGPGTVALGLALGIVAGLPPVGLFTALVVVAFLVFRAHLGMFLVALGLAKAAGLAAAPALDELGRRLLEASALKGLWTFLLNLPVISLCGLDRYLAFGATVAAFLIAAAVFLLVWLLLPPLRRAFWGRVARSARLKGLSEKRLGKGMVRFVFGRKTVEPADAAGSGKIFRKGFLVPAGVAVLVFVVLVHLFGDGLARRGIELVSTQVLRRDVTLASADLGLFGGSLRLGDMLVRNLQTDDAGAKVAQGQRFTLDFRPLAVLDRRLVVDELGAENLVYHARQSPDQPALPPEPAPGEKVGLEDVLAYVEANRKQIEWVLGQLDGLLRGGEAAPDPKAPGFKGRAAYVYGTRSEPAILIRKAGVKNLVFDWKDTGGPLAGLERLDLELSEVSSNPVRHAAPIALAGGGSFLGSRLTLEGVLDVRAQSNEGHRLDLGLEVPAFARASRLGLGAGRDLRLALGAAFDPATRRLREARCTGSFVAEGTAQVAFALTSGERLGIEAEVKGVDLARLGAVRKPEALRADRGLLDLEVRFGVVQGKLDGALGLSARDLALAPGREKQLAGVSAADFCAALNALTRTRPLVVSLKIGGTPASPTVHLDDAGMKGLLEQVKAGLVAAGRNAVAAEVDRRLGELAGKLGAEIPASLDPAEAARRLQEEAAKKAKGALEGLLGGRKKKAEEDKDPDK